MGHPIHKHMNSGMSRASSAEKYDAKEAYNKDLSSKARMHYLENDIADKKGMSRNTSPLNDFKGGYHKVQHAKGEAHKSPAKNITYGDKSGPTGYIGEQRADDMKYNPVDDRAGMSRYKSNDKGSPAKQKYNEVNVQDLQDMGKVKKNKKGKYVVNENAKTAKDTLYIPKKTKSYTGKKIKVGQMIDESDYENLSKKANNPVSRNKYGGNKGDERRSAKKDYDGMSRYGGNKGDIKRSAKKDY